MTPQTFSVLDYGPATVVASWLLTWFAHSTVLSIAVLGSFAALARFGVRELGSAGLGSESTRLAQLVDQLGSEQNRTETPHAYQHSAVTPDLGSAPDLGSEQNPTKPPRAYQNSAFAATPVARVTIMRLALVVPLISASVAVVNTPFRAAPAYMARLYRANETNLDVSVSRRETNGKVTETRSVNDATGARDARTIIWFAIVAAAGGTIWLALRLVQAKRVLSKRVSARATDIAELHALEAMGTRSSGIASRVHLSVLPNLASPVALWRNEIVVPPTFLDASRNERTAVLLHEIVHLDRRDTPWSLAFDTAVALAWMNPTLHALRWTHRREVELAADYLATARGARPASMIAALYRFVNAMEAEAPNFGTAFTRRPSLTLERANVLLHIHQQSAIAGVGLRRVAAIVVTASAAILLLSAPIVTVASPLAASGRADDSHVVQAEVREVTMTTAFPYK